MIPEKKKKKTRTSHVKLSVCAKRPSSSVSFSVVLTVLTMGVHIPRALVEDRSRSCSPPRCTSPGLWLRTRSALMLPASLPLGHPCSLNRSPSGLTPGLCLRPFLPQHEVHPPSLQVSRQKAPRPRKSRCTPCALNVVLSPSEAPPSDFIFLSILFNAWWPLRVFYACFYFSISSL